jgi:TonB family protein
MGRVRLVIATAILTHAFAWSQLPGTPSDEVRFDRGKIANGVYTNDCFGFSIPIPAGWEVSAIPGLADGKALHLPGGGLGLLLVSRHRDKSFGDSIALNATDASKYPAMTVQGFVSASGRQQVNADPQRREIIHDALPVEFGGKQFFRADHKQSFPNGYVQYAAFVYTKFRGYFVGETLMAASPEALDEAADSLRGLSFKEDQPNPKCVIGPDDGPRMGVIGGIISSRPGTGPTSSGAPLRVRVSAGVSQGLLIKRVQPDYPEAARKGGVEGTVVLKTMIDTNGDVEDVTVISGDPVLVPAAVDAVKRWKYKPYTLNGQPTKVETNVTVAFQLSPN